MDRLESLKEELRQMEEANKLGQLNSNEKEYLVRLREEVLKTENKLIEDEVNRKYMEDLWVQEHLLEQEGLQKELEMLEGQYALKQEEFQREGLIYDANLEEIGKRISFVKSDLNLLANDFKKKRESIRNSVLEAHRLVEEKNDDKQVKEDISHDEKLENNISIESLIEQRVEELYLNDAWVKDHLKEQEGLRNELYMLEEQFSLKEAELKRSGMLFSSDLEEIANKMQKIQLDLNLLDNDFARRKDNIRLSFEAKLEEQVEQLYNNDSWVKDHLKEQEGLQKELADLEEQRTLKKAEVDRNGMLFSSDLDEIDKKILKIKADLDLLESDFAKRRESIKINLLNNNINDRGLSVEDERINEVVPNRETINGLLPPASEEVNGLLPPASEEVNGLLPPADDKVYGLLPPAKESDKDPINSPVAEDDPEQVVDPTNPPVSEDDPEQVVDPTNPPVSEDDPEQVVAPINPPVSEDDPEQVVDPTNPPVSEEVEEEIHKKRSLEAILHGLIEGDEVVGLKDRDYRHYQGRNIKITAEGMKRQVFGDGPRAYKLARAPKLITHTFVAIVTLGKKISGMLFSSKASREKIEVIRKRLDNLSEEDLLTLREEYLGSQIVQAKLPSFVDSMIQEKLRVYNQEVVARLTSEVDQIVNELYLKENVVDEIERLRLTGEISAEEASRRMELAANGSADLIKAYRAKNQEIIRLTSRGRDEDFRAAHTGMNLAGRRGAKKNKEITSELQNAWEETSEIEQDMLDSVVEKDDLNALDAFVDYTSAIEKHTAHQDSLLFGKKSVGLREATPISRQLDYREDPLLKDLTSSVMQITAIVNIANTISAEMQKQQMIRDHNAELAKHNQDLTDAQKTVNSSGEKLVGHSDAYARGMKANSMQRMQAQNTAHERGSLEMYADQSGGWQGSLNNPDYAQRDHDISHVFDREVYTDLSDRFTKASSDLSAGKISPEEYLRQIRDISNGFVKSSQSEFQEAYQITMDYAKMHPEFDLTAYQGSLDYTINHMQDIVDMNSAMVESVNIGQVLQSLPLEHAQMLGQLPNSMLSNLITSAVLMKSATHIARETDKVEDTVKRTKSQEVIAENVRQEHSEEIIREAEARYYNMSKLKQTFARLQWRKIQELKEMQGELTQEDVETIKGAFR